MALSFEEHQKWRIDNYNNGVGGLKGYDCPKCKNKGDFMVLYDGYELIRECECMAVRRTVKLIEESGLKDLLRDYTFEKYKTTQAWQEGAKSTAMQFLRDCENRWFFAGGQIGSGKSHLCTAIVGELIKRGYPAHYMLWRDEVVSLKANVTDDAAYSKAMKKLKEIKVLYIDDFFKTERGKMPTTAEINIAFEILNYRYNNKELITVISSERFLDDIIRIDEAVGSRIKQRAKGYCLLIGYDEKRNYRLSGDS